MVASNHNFVSVGQGSEPVIEVFHIIQSAGTQAVAGVNQHIAIRHVWYASMQAVGVGNANEPHGVSPYALNGNE
jgi:hypothetical protein